MTTATYPGFPPTPPTPPTPPPTPPTPPTPQYPGQPSYPVAPGQLPYAPQFPQAQGYPQPQMAMPPQPLAQGTLDDFFNQPSAGGGKSLSFNQLGQRYVGIVTRPLGPGDVQQQTDTRGLPQYFKDGRPKFVMKVPLQMQPSPTHPDGLGTWFVKGQARDELVRAMGEAGAPAGPPEPGSIIDVTYVADRPSGQGMNPSKQFRIVYTRPQGTAPAAPPAQPPAAPPVAEAPPAPAPLQPAYPAAAAAPAAVAQAPAGPQPPADLTPEQQALLAKLTGATAG